MTTTSALDKPHRRFNLLTGEWVVVSPHRTQRPWQGHEGDAAQPLPQHDAGCYLCPGNSRAGGFTNPSYDDVFIFDNDFPALLDETIDAPISEGMFRAEPVCGCCRVICYGPRHDQPLHHMDEVSVQRVVNAWMEQSRSLSQRYEWVQIFENRGGLMGASSPHPHGQIWALDALPTEASKEAVQQKAAFERDGQKLLLSYLAQELDQKTRIIFETEHWVAVVPFWAIWPFESLILPRASVSRLHEMTPSVAADLAPFLKGLLHQYDRLFDAPMSFSMGWHSAPAGDEFSASWQLHGHVYPPALRSATIPKFMVGFELLGEKQRDITPEEAARRLREA
ncbi:MAG: UDP-glucose--hexose-1-phosphate uridylyltransferase [Gammaproteobacteria bacterium]